MPTVILVVSLLVHMYIHVYTFLFLDIDECDQSSALCHTNATCTNTIGSYQCFCKAGFEGDGALCGGIKLSYENLCKLYH